MSNTYHVGIIGLGKMGEAIAYRLLQANYNVIGFDPTPESQESLRALGGKVATDISALAQAGVIWIMVPAGKPVDDVLEQLKPHLTPNTIIVDGGNSHFPDTVRRCKELEVLGVSYLDCGTSGGLKGREIGFSLMVGGDKEAYKKTESFLQAIAAPGGYEHMGPSGAGHYVKMVHNGIEYAILQSYAEGLHLLRAGSYKDLDLAKITGVWKNGSVIRSWIVDLLEEIFVENPDFEKISGAIGENLTGQWTLQEAEKQNVPMILLKDALAIRAWSRKESGNFGTKIVALLRNKFGGHPIEEQS